MASFRNFILLLLFSFAAFSSGARAASLPASPEPVPAVASSGKTVAARNFKLGFFKKLLLRIYMKKMAKKFHAAGGTADADKKANASLVFGIAAIVFLFIPTYTIFLVIPLGILAMVFGNQALKEGTSKELNAKLGKGFGLGALIAFLVLLLIAVIVITSSPWWF